MDPFYLFSIMLFIGDAFWLAQALYFRKTGKSILVGRKPKAKSVVYKRLVKYSGNLPFAIAAILFIPITANYILVSHFFLYTQAHNGGIEAFIFNTAFGVTFFSWGLLSQRTRVKDADFWEAK
jgi:hypothetical protein